MPYPLARLDIIFAGSGEYGLPTLSALLEAGHRIVQVVSQPDRPAGRGRRLWPTPISAFARQHGLPLLTTDDINAERLVPADLMLVIAFGQKIAPHQVEHARLGGINLHASRLPRLRGAAPINWAILRGDQITGNSVIRLAQRLDAGDILAQSLLTIGELETAGELHERLARDGAALVPRVIDDLAGGVATATPQLEHEATLAPKLSREAGRIDWSAGGAEIARRIRGLFPWPGCHVAVVDEQGSLRGRLTLVRARPGAATSAAPGVIDERGQVGSGDGIAVEVLEVQPEGKRPMSLAAYRRGHPWTAGMRLESL